MFLQTIFEYSLKSPQSKRIIGSIRKEFVQTPQPNLE
jgi:hypothetical protein